MTKFEQPSGLLMIATAPGYPPWAAESVLKKQRKRQFFGNKCTQPASIPTVLGELFPIVLWQVATLPALG